MNISSNFRKYLNISYWDTQGPGWNCLTKKLEAENFESDSLEMGGTRSISKICVLTNQIVLWVLIKNHHYFLDFWNGPLMSNWILHFPGGCGEKIIENNFCWSSAKSTLNISNTIWTNNVLLILKVRKVFFIWTKHITTVSRGPSLFWASNCSERSKGQFMGQKSLCPSRGTPRNGQIFVLPAHKK